MLRRILWRVARAVILAMAVLPAAALTQAQDSANQSVAEAARRARDQKKKIDKPVRVVTEDMLNPAAGPVAQFVPSSSSPDASQAQAAPGDPSAAAPADAAAVKNSPETDALQQELADKQKELALAQSELALQQDTYLSNPDHATDTAGKAKMDAMQAQVTEKQQQLDDLKTRLAASKELQTRAPQSTPPAPAQAPALAPAAPSGPKPAPPPPLPPGES
jgi:uncharacterized protein YhaN